MGGTFARLLKPSAVPAECAKAAIGRAPGDRLRRH